MKPIRQQLRNESTFAEEALWFRLRRSQLDGRKFRRQHSIGYFILDFYCPAERLAIEVDGFIHDAPENQANDQERDRALATLDITVLRVRNEEIAENVFEVLERIRNCFRK
ncbi:endonuclease domain-containing protein [Larkinella soli]|uniref:endonuclease domain-containing protein n=1 Tax=Larkinella soli TaxID=1770527 RepID=UPI001E48720E|nr:endonuclease domain-containing protein [Larkinella soli]